MWKQRVASFSLVGSLLLAPLGLSACGPSAGYFRASTVESKTETVSVRFVEQDNDVFEFLVFNLSDVPQTLLRDEILLRAGSIELRRESGGLASTYDLPPGGSHGVKVKYDLSQIQGVTSFDVSFEHAVVTKGQPVSGPVVHLVRK